MTRNRQIRSQLGFQAIASLRVYAACFPDDQEPMRAIASVLSYANGESQIEDVLRHRPEIKARIDWLRELVMVSKVTRGFMYAALRALELVDVCLGENMDEEKERLGHRLLADAKAATKGV